MLSSFLRFFFRLFSVHLQKAQAPFNRSQRCVDLPCTQTIMLSSFKSSPCRTATSASASATSCGSTHPLNPVSQLDCNDSLCSCLGQVLTLPEAEQGDTSTANDSFLECYIGYVYKEICNYFHSLYTLGKHQELGMFAHPKNRSVRR